MGSLQNNSIGDAGARDLGAALQVNTTLKTLRWCQCVAVGKSPTFLARANVDSLIENRISDAGARDLGAALHVNTTLVTLK
jgi:hypothetical protein